MEDVCQLSLDLLRALGTLEWGYAIALLSDSHVCVCVCVCTYVGAYPARLHNYDTYIGGGLILRSKVIIYPRSFQRLALGSINTMILYIYTVLQSKSVDFFIKLHADLFTCTINKNGSYMD